MKRLDTRPSVCAPDFSVIEPDTSLLSSVCQQRARDANAADPDSHNEHSSLSLSQVSLHGKHDAKETVARDDCQSEDTANQGKH